MWFWIVVGWLACSALVYGMAVPMFKHASKGLRDNYREDLGISVALAAFGPFAVLPVFCISGFCKHGIRWW